MDTSCARACAHACGGHCLKPINECTEGHAAIVQASCGPVGLYRPCCDVTPFWAQCRSTQL
eukprot:1141776-Pelagomonas_calceolata.AAC.7